MATPEGLEEFISGCYIFPEQGNNATRNFMPCVHVLCTRCLGEIESRTGRKEGDKINCKVCGIKMELLPSSRSTANADRPIADILLEMSAMGNQNKGPTCKECWLYHKETLATKLCRNCNKYLCQSCATTHYYHQKDIKDISSHLTDNKPGLEKNKSHQYHRRWLEVYCLVCGEAFCISCFIEDDKISTKLKQDLEETVIEDFQRLSKMSEGLKRRKEQLRTEKQRLNEDISRLNKDIHEAAEELKRLIEERERTLKNEVKSAQKTKAEQLEAEQKRIDKILNSDAFKISPQNKKIVDLFYDWNGIREVNKQCDEVLQHRNPDTQLFFRKFNIDPNIIGSLEEDAKQLDMLDNSRDSTSDMIQRKETSKAPVKPDKNIRNVDQVRFRRVIPFPNFGNTCFMNAVIQVLCHTKVLVDLLGTRSSMSGKDSWKESGKLTDAFVALNSMMESGDIDIPYSQKHPIEVMRDKMKRFADGHQNDSHFLLIHVLNKFRDEERKEFLAPGGRLLPRGSGRGQKPPGDLDPMKILTTVDEVFGGHILTVYICLTCSAPYHICEPFLDLSLPVYQRQTTQHSNQDDKKLKEYIHKNLSVGNEYQIAITQALQPFNLETSSSEGPGRLEANIVSSLKHFTRLEHIRNEYLCSECSSRASNAELSSAAKRTFIYNPPAILTIHLKRFHQQYPSGMFVKNDEHIYFDHFLDIAPFCSSACVNANQTDGNIWYELYAVVVHLGSLSAGHYLAYVKVREEEPDLRQFLQQRFFDRDRDCGKEEIIREMKKLQNMRKSKRWTVPNTAPSGIWYCVNDSRIEKVKPPSHGSFDEVLSQNAYMLFYEKMEESSLKEMHC